MIRAEYEQLQSQWEQLKKQYEEKCSYWRRLMHSVSQPKKRNTEEYTQWLELRLKCMTHMWMLEQNYKAFPTYHLVTVPAEVAPLSEIVEPKPKVLRGYVYLLKMVNGDYYKIGRTKNYQNRLETFGVKLPFSVEYEYIIQTKDMYALESELHQRFAAKRVNGEWFALSQVDIDYIKSL